MLNEGYTIPFLIKKWLFCDFQIWYVQYMYLLYAIVKFYKLSTEIVYFEESFASPPVLFCMVSLWGPPKPLTSTQMCLIYMYLSCAHARFPQNWSRVMWDRKGDFRRGANHIFIWPIRAQQGKPAKKHVDRWVYFMSFWTEKPLESHKYLKFDF